MPNHCSNDLFVDGPSEAIDRFITNHVKVDDHDGAVLDCNSIIPYPTTFAELDAVSRAWDVGMRTAVADVKNESERVAAYRTYVERAGDRPRDGFNSGGYEWCIANWGTKWGCYNGASLERTESGIKLTYDTAWSPVALELLLRLSELNPELIIRNEYFECGAGFEGHTTVHNGEVVSSDFREDYDGERGG